MASDPKRPTQVERARFATLWNDYILALKAYQMGLRRDRPEKPALPGWVGKQ